MSLWLDSISHWLSANPQWLGLSVFLLATGECLAIVGLIVPGTVLLFAIAVVAGSGVLSLGQTLLLAYAGGLLGDGLSYAIGRYFYDDIRRLPGLRQHPEWLAQAQRYFQRHGMLSLLIGRFIGPLRPMLPMVAGMMKMPVGHFAAVSLCAAAGWSVVYLLPGWSTGAAMRLPLPAGFWPQLALVGGVLITLALLSSHSCLRSLRHTSLLNAALCFAALSALLLGWRHLQALDNGLLALSQHLRGPQLDYLASLITGLGDWPNQLAAGALLCLLLLAYRQWRAALFSSISLLGSALATAALKQLLSRARPDIVLDPLSGYSLPSGHSSAAFALFLTLGVLTSRSQSPRQRLGWLLLATLPALAIALSRVYLGAHWPSDIIAGALLASLCCALSLGLSQWRQPLPALPRPAWPLLAAASLITLILLSGWQSSARLLSYSH